MYQSKTAGQIMGVFVSYFSVLLYRVLLDICYYYVVSPKYSWCGYTAKPTFCWYLVSWSIYLCCVPTMIKLNKMADKISDFAILILLLIAFTPFTTMVGIYVFPANFVFYATVFWYTLVLGHNFMHNSRKTFVFLKKQTFSNRIYMALYGVFVLFAGVLILAVSWRYRHFAVSFNLAKAYEVRFQAMKFNISPLFSYLLSMSDIILLLAIAYFVCAKKYCLATIAICVQVINFGIAEHKAILFKLILTIGICLTYKFMLKRKIVLWMNILLLMCVIEFYALKTYKIAWLIIWRAMFITTRLSYLYFDFFTKHEPDYFAQSFMRHFGIVSTYPPIPYMISEIYDKEATVMANNGLVADAITNYGWCGMVLLPIVITVFLCLLDWCAKKLRPEISIIVALQVAVGLQNMFLPTFLLTAGGIVMCISTYMLSKQLPKSNCFIHTSV